MAESASQLGRDLKTAGAQRDASLALYRRALDIRTRCFGPDSPEVASSLMDIANLHRAMFRRKQALPDFERALAIRRMHYGSHSEEVASTLTAMALTHTAAGDWRAAEPLVREALTIRRSLGATPREGLMISIGTYGMVLRHLGRYAEAESMMVEAIAMQEARRRMARPGSGRVGMFPLAMYWELAATRLEQGHGTEAWLAAERALGRVLLEAAIARGEVPAADPWEDLLARLQRSLPDSAAVVGWIDLRGGAGDSEYPFWCYAIRHTGPIFWQRVDRPPGKSDPSFDLTVRRATSELRAAAGWPLRVSDASELGRITLAIYRIRIEPLEPALRGVRTLHIVAPDVMYAVPIDAVADTTGRLLGDRFDISYAPSALLYVLAHERHPVAEARHGWRGLLVGSPEPTGGHPTLPRLEAAGEEVRALAGLLDRPTVLLGADATESRLAELARAHRLASFDLIHLATHADVDEFWPGRSAFLLADYRREAESQETIALDGRLTSDEIAASWSLDARLVSLAACRSLWGSRSRTEGFVGLNQSFLQAGAHTLLVSLWQVDDRATALLLGRFYRDALAPRGPRMPLSAALREAKAWLRAWQAPDGSRPYQHPVYWSGLVLLGTTD